MAKGKDASGIISVSAVVISFVALMTAVWCFANAHIAAGVYNIVIVAVSTITFIVVGAKAVASGRDQP